MIYFNDNVSFDFIVYKIILYHNDRVVLLIINIIKRIFIYLYSANKGTVPKKKTWSQSEQNDQIYCLVRTRKYRFSTVFVDLW